MKTQALRQAAPVREYWNEAVETMPRARLELREGLERPGEGEPGGRSSGSGKRGPPMSRMPGDKTAPSRGEHDAKTLAMILETIRGLRFGVVTIIVHDGVVMQVERTEKFRFATRREMSGEGEGI